MVQINMPPNPMNTTPSVNQEVFQSDRYISTFDEQRMDKTNHHTNQFSIQSQSQVSNFVPTIFPVTSTQHNKVQHMNPKETVVPQLLPHGDDYFQLTPKKRLLLGQSVFSPQPSQVPTKNGLSPLSLLQPNHYSSTIADKIKLLLTKSALTQQQNTYDSSLTGAANLMIGKHQNPMTTTLGNISSLQKHISSQHQLFNLLKDLNAQPWKLQQYYHTQKLKFHEYYRGGGSLPQMESFVIDLQTQSFDKRGRSDIIGGGMTLQGNGSGDRIKYQVPGASKLHESGMLATIGGTKYSHAISPSLSDNKYQSKYQKTFMKIKEKPLPDSIMIRRKALLGQGKHSKQEDITLKIPKEPIIQLNRSSTVDLRQYPELKSISHIAGTNETIYVSPQIRGIEDSYGDNFYNTQQDPDESRESSKFYQTHLNQLKPQHQQHINIFEDMGIHAAQLTFHNQTGSVGGESDMSQRGLKQNSDISHVKRIPLPQQKQSFDKKSHSRSKTSFVHTEKVDDGKRDSQLSINYILGDESERVLSQGSNYLKDGRLVHESENQHTVKILSKDKSLTKYNFAVKQFEPPKQLKPIHPAKKPQAPQHKRNKSKIITKTEDVFHIDRNKNGNHFMSFDERVPQDEAIGHTENAQDSHKVTLRLPHINIQQKISHTQITEPKCLEIQQKKKIIPTGDQAVLVKILNQLQNPLSKQVLNSIKHSVDQIFENSAITQASSQYLQAKGSQATIKEQIWDNSKKTSPKQSLAAKSPPKQQQYQHITHQSGEIVHTQIQPSIFSFPMQITSQIAVPERQSLEPPSSINSNTPEKLDTPFQQHMKILRNTGGIDSPVLASVNSRGSPSQHQESAVRERNNLQAIFNYTDAPLRQPSINAALVAESKHGNEQPKLKNEASKKKLQKKQQQSPKEKVAVAQTMFRITNYPQNPRNTTKQTPYAILKSQMALQMRQTLPQPALDNKSQQKLIALGIQQQQIQLKPKQTVYQQFGGSPHKNSPKHDEEEELQSARPVTPSEWRGSHNGGDFMIGAQSPLRESNNEGMQEYTEQAWQPISPMSVQIGRDSGMKVQLFD